MARTYAQLFTSVWKDEKWCSLSLAEQAVYTMLLRQPKLSLVGVIDYLPDRWRDFCGDEHEVFDTALDSLEDKNYVVIDLATSELLVRSFVKWELQRPSATQVIGLWNAYNEVLSPALREVVLANIPEAVWTVSATPKVTVPEGVKRPPNTPCDTPSQTPTHSPVPEPGPEHQPQPTHETARQALAVIAHDTAQAEVRRRQQSSDPIKFPTRFEASVLERITAERWDDALRLAEMDLSSDEIVAKLTAGATIGCDRCEFRGVVPFDPDDTESEIIPCPSCNLADHLQEQSA